MKRFFACILILSFTFYITACNAGNPLYSVVKTGGTGTVGADAPTVMQDNTEVTPVIVSTVRSYEKRTLDNTGGYHLSGVEQDIYLADGYLCVPTGNYSTTGLLGTTILKYDGSGTLTEAVAVPYFKGISVIDVRPLSDGRFIYYSETENGNHHDTFLMITDADGNVLHRIDLPRQEISITNAIYTNHVGMHVDEREDGSVRIFINAWHEAYYLDGELTLLNTVPFRAEYQNIHMESDGVYILGCEMPQVARIDMNAGTIENFDHEDLSVPPEMVYHSRIYYSPAGQQYCLYDGVLYRCDGNRTVTEILRWEYGPATGDGLIWVLDDSAVYYMQASQQSLAGYASLVLLDIRDDDTVYDRRVLRIANRSTGKKEWLYEVTSRFNSENTSYFVEILDYTENSKDQLASDFLSGNAPDMVLSSSVYLMQDYIDKGVMLDLAPYWRDGILNGAADAFSVNGQMYLLPLSMQLSTFVSASAVFDGTLTWDALYDMEAALLRGEYRALLSDASAVSDIEDTMLSDFFDYTAMTASFDSDEFRRRVCLLDAMETDYLGEHYGFLRRNLLSYDQYALTASYIADALCDGEIPLLNVPLETVEAYSVLKLLFGDEDFAFCGYPSDSGIGAAVSSTALLGVCADSDSLGGCREFIDFLLSDEVQTSPVLTADALPVTRSGMEKTLEEYRYFYYDSSLFRAADGFSILGSSTTNLRLQAVTHSAQPDDALSAMYTVVEITDEDRAVLLDFFERFRAGSGADPVISQIVEEELSAYTSGAKTLEEVTSLIQSRVWIYLNE